MQKIEKSGFIFLRPNFMKLSYRANDQWYRTYTNIEKQVCQLYCHDMLEITWLTKHKYKEILISVRKVDAFFSLRL